LEKKKILEESFFNKFKVEKEMAGLVIETIELSCII
jgi:hypothetical protein